MGFEETVMSDLEMMELGTGSSRVETEHAIAKLQAKRSFKAGRAEEYEKWLKACRKAGILITTEEDLPAIVRGLKQTGIQEVVEQIRPIMDCLPDPILQHNWQAQCKKWGID